MGGVGDYSGGLVLQVATAATTSVALAAAPTAAGAEDAAALRTSAFGAEALPLAWLRAWSASSAGSPLSARLALVRAHLQALGAPRWVSYVFGSLAGFVGETGWLPPPGSSLTIDISSSVPLSQGVSSSASIEVAMLRALRAHSGAPLADLRLAHVGQHVENFVVGAPCGLMDQLASSLGAPAQVLPILCRPDAVSALVALPPGVLVVGWPSGAEHELGGASPYGLARAATFMAKKVLERALGRQLAHITELQPSELAAVAASVPEAMSGRDFLAQYGAMDDALSVVDPNHTYSLRASAQFPVGENFRCAGGGGAQWSTPFTCAHSFSTAQRSPFPHNPCPPPPSHTHCTSRACSTPRCATALALLRSLAGQAGGAAATEEALALVGELMRQTHRGYTSIGLGAPELDEMLEALGREIGLRGGVYGARISGGGSGGTMAILCHERALPAIRELAGRLTFGKPFPGLIM